MKTEMKIKRILRPDIELQYKNVLGFLYCLYGICKTGVKIINIKYLICVGGTPNKNNYVKVVKTLVIPKYHLKKMR